MDSGIGYLALHVSKLAFKSCKSYKIRVARSTICGAALFPAALLGVLRPLQQPRLYSIYHCNASPNPSTQYCLLCRPCVLQLLRVLGPLQHAPLACTACTPVP
eukprot:GHUV01027370.1.p4 GENE.GHUV01027370.1~~GHUV01027370.1.p4  ORF type:complete len:103 (+),score=8.40 GHUV01027370.1:217-525(+)